VENKTINILGEEWKIEFRKESEDDKLTEVDGYCDCTIRTIVCGKFVKDSKMSLSDLNNITMRILRHEIIHAMLYESGLKANCNWAKNEECVDWIALQFPKLLEIFKKEGIDK